MASPVSTKCGGARGEFDIIVDARCDFLLMSVAARRFGPSLRRAQWCALRVVRTEKTAAGGGRGSGTSSLRSYAGRKAFALWSRGTSPNWAAGAAGRRRRPGAAGAGEANTCIQFRLHVSTSRDLHIVFMCFSNTCFHSWLHVFSFGYMYSVSVTCI